MPLHAHSKTKGVQGQNCSNAVNLSSAPTPSFKKWKEQLHQYYLAIILESALCVSLCEHVGLGE